MGPDELATREELGLIVRFMFAKFQQQAQTIAALSALLIDRGVLSDAELAALMTGLQDSPNSRKAEAALAKLREFATIHKIARQYLDPPEA